MRLLVNENVTRTVIEELRRRGHDVLSAKESMRSEPDDVILERAQADQRIVVTHDKDFGELAFRRRLPASCGVIIFRLTGPNPDTDNKRILEALDSRTDWEGQFSVVTDDRISMRLRSSTRRLKSKTGNLPVAEHRGLTLARCATFGTSVVRSRRREQETRDRGTTP